MNLWIRSQDKTMLCKPQYIELQGTNEIAMGDINIGYRCVATYKSKERALEVLDEIQNKLMPISVYKQEVDNLTIDFKNIDTIVYKMPKE